jgi:hypothetical protein
MKTTFALNLNDTPKNRGKESLLSKLEIAFDDEVNDLPDSYYNFIEKMQYGKTYIITFEELNAS